MTMGRQYYRKKSNYYKKKWKPYHKKSYSSSYRSYDFLEDFHDNYQAYNIATTQPAIIPEFKVKPFFDQTFPRYSIRIETNTYFGYIPLKLRESVLNNIPDVISLLSEVFEASVVFIEMLSENGDKEVLYQSDNSSPTPDPKVASFAKMLINGRDVLRFPISRVILPTYEYWKNNLRKLNQIFTDSLGNNLEKYHIYFSSRPEKLLRITKNSHFDPIAPASQEYSSGLETFLEEALIKNAIKFEKQIKIIFNDQVLSIPDFVISGTHILIYSDGFKYHSSNQKMNIDRKQDRILQNLGYRVLRFTDSEIENDIQSVIYEILETIRLESSP